MEYAKLFAEFAENHQIQVWLVNTGWSGGAVGKGHRIPITTTRELIRAVQNHELDAADFSEEPYFNLRIPNQVLDLNEKLLNPVKSWSAPEEYRKAAAALKERFELQLGKYRH
jgi:phosphoenolpyruvate carboxykinase (ATP)